MRESTASTAEDYLRQAQQRLQLEDVTQSDIKRAKEQAKKAVEQLEELEEE